MFLPRYDLDIVHRDRVFGVDGVFADSGDVLSFCFAMFTNARVEGANGLPDVSVCTLGAADLVH